MGFDNNIETQGTQCNCVIHGTLIVLCLIEIHCTSLNVDDMMGVHLKVREEAEKKKSETIASGEEYIQLTDEMITARSCRYTLTQGSLSPNNEKTFFKARKYNFLIYFLKKMLFQQIIK